MSFTYLWLVGLVALLCTLPWIVKWLQRRTGLGQGRAGDGVQLVSALALGPQQRVMTVEVGPADARVRLVLGVTAQHITCLHSHPVRPVPDPLDNPDTVPAMTFSQELQGQKLG